MQERDKQLLISEKQKANKTAKGHLSRHVADGHELQPGSASTLTGETELHLIDVLR
jgi:hypothetical protein